MENFQTVFQVVVPSYSFINIECISCSILFPTFSVFNGFNLSHFRRRIQLWFQFVFPWLIQYWPHFQCLLDFCIISFVNSLFVYSLIVWFMSPLYSGCKSFVMCASCSYFLTVSGLYKHFLNRKFWWVEGFNFHGVQFILNICCVLPKNLCLLQNTPR